jgi:hypothetical protein
MSRGRAIFAVTVLAAVVAVPLAGLGRDAVAVQQPLEADSARPTAVPFGPGERAAYRVSLSRVGNVGRGEMNVTGVQDVRGHRAYHFRFTIEGGVLFARVNNQLESWMDVNRLLSLRFKQNQHEVNYRRNRSFEFYPEERRWELDNGQTGELASSEPLDDVSFLYFVRTLPLEVGQTYTLNRYFQESGNPVIVRVLRREQITVPAGTFQTIVVQPIIRTKGLFGEGGRAEVYFSDDDRRLLVMLTSRVPIVGNLNLQLQSYQPGQPLTQ